MERARPDVQIIHLASVLVLHDPVLVIAAWGRRLQAGAGAAGLAAAPGELG